MKFKKSSPKTEPVLRPKKGKGSQFVVISEEEMTEFAEPFGLKSWSRPDSREELLFAKVVNKKPLVRAILFTSIAPGEAQTRGYAKDAMRFQLQSEEGRILAGENCNRILKWKIHLGGRVRRLLSKEVVDKAVVTLERLKLAEEAIPQCPLCKGEMRVRNGPKAGVFYGCKTYPRCKGFVGGPGSSEPARLERVTTAIAPPRWKTEKWVLAKLDGPDVVFVGPCTFEAAGAFRTFGLAWDKAKKEWRGPAKTLTERHTLAEEIEAVGIEVRVPE